MSSRDNKKPPSDDNLRKKVASLRKAKTVWLWVTGISFSLCFLSIVFLCIVFLFVWDLMPDKFVEEYPWVPPCASVILCVLSIIFLQFFVMCKNKIRVVVSEAILPELLREKFTNVTYHAKKRISWKLVKSVNMVDGLGEIRGHNHFLGLYKGRKVEFSDLWLFCTNVSLYGVRGDRTTFFRGPWITFDIGMPVPTRIKICRRTGVFADAKSNVITSNARFNSLFQVFADNPHLAYAILTPQFMARVMRIGGNVRMCFEPGRAHVAFNTGGDTFEVTGEEYEMKDLDGMRERFRKEIRHLTDIVDIICDGDGLSTL